eukprot:s1359_g13.t1
MILAIWNSDGWNSRLMTWLVREELLQLETPVRRLSSVGDENTTGTETTMTTTSMTMTTSYTISTTSTTTYTGPRYFLEMDGFTGRPYGIYGGIYVSDADGCVIWKKTTTGQKSLVVGGTCGFSTSQLYFPSGLVVEMGGAIIIADSRNNRIIRFGSEPTPSNVEKCTLGGNCEEPPASGEKQHPDHRERRLRWWLRGLWAGRWLLGFFAWPTASASDRDYIMCYGPEGNEAQLQRGTPCTADLDGYGIPAADLVVVAIIDSAYGTGVACGTGSTQNFQGYRAFFLQNPGFLQPIVEPYLSQGNRSANVQVFFGQAEVAENMLFVMDTDVAVLTPSYRTCTSLSFQETASIQFDNPVANASSATVSSMTSSDGLNIAFFDLGIARDNGMFQVCYCASYDGEDADFQTCSSAAEFTHSAGTLVIMRVNSQDYECAMNRACSVEVSGLYMAATDILLETGGLATCGSIVPQEAAVVAGVSFQQNFFAAQALSASDAGGTSDPNASQLFQLITFTVPGDRRLCYCSTYDAEPQGGRFMEQEQEQEQEQQQQQEEEEEQEEEE